MIVKAGDPFTFSDREYHVHPWDVENNPYLVFWARSHNDAEALSKETGIELRGNDWDRLHFNIQARWTAISKYGFAIPDYAALNLVKRKSPNGVVEIGAGSGYWAKMLSLIGVTVEAYDSYAGKYKHAFTHGEHATVQRMNHAAALSNESSKDRTLLLCWPDYCKPWPSETLALYKGNVVVYVGEGDGGCTGNDEFHKTLDDDWVHVVSRSIPQWWGFHDALHIYERRRKKKRRKP